LTLLELHAELSETNRHLARIADALERAIPLTREEVLRSHRGQHPLVGREDVSTMTPTHAAEVDIKRATMPLASNRVDFHSAARGAQANERAYGTEEPSVTGAWDHDDPLDTFDEFGEERWDNYAGVDR